MYRLTCCKIIVQKRLNLPFHKKLTLKHSTDLKLIVVLYLFNLHNYTGNYRPINSLMIGLVCRFFILMFYIHERTDQLLLIDFDIQ